MCIVDLPKLLAVVNSVSPDLAVAPSTDDHLIGENGAQRNDCFLTRCRLGLVYAASCHSIRVRVPKTDSSIFTACDELVRYARHEPGRVDRLCVVLTEEHLREILVPQPVQVAFLCCNKTLQAIRATRESMDCSEELSSVDNGRIVAVDSNGEDLAVTTTADERSW